MKRLVSLIILLFIGLQVSAQVSSDMNGRLYRLCKVWGYMKYFSQQQCNVKWDTLLRGVVKQTLLTNSNDEFNTILLNRLLNKVGNNVFIANPPGALPDTNINFNDGWIHDSLFSPAVLDFLSTFSSHIYQSNRTCVDQYNNYSDPNYGSFIDFKKDLISIPLDYKKEEDRLTAAFQCWSVIDYFDPYRSIMDQPWDTTLVQFIPQIRNALTDLDFQKAIARMLRYINDGHGFVQSTVLAEQFWGGYAYPPITCIKIGNQCVIKKTSGISGIMPGDILLSVGGKDLKSLTDSIAPYVPASDSAGFYYNFYHLMMEGGMNSPIALTLLDSTQHAYSIDIPRSMDAVTFFTWINSNEDILPYYITTCGSGYVDMNLLQSADVADMYAALRNTPAIIFDLRNYPNGTLWDLAPLLFTAPVTSTIYYYPALAKAPENYYLPGWFYKTDDHDNLGHWNNPEPYSGKIFILVNESTLSQAEYTCQYLSHHPNAKVIGSQTQGADGNVSYNDLPNNLYTNFTSLGWYYEDGYQQQRKGVKINEVVRPTAEGLRHGRDEVLEAALECLTQTTSIAAEPRTISIFPNPVMDFLTIQFSDDANTSRNIQLYNSQGQLVYHQIADGLLQEIDMSEMATGIYFLNVVSGNQNIISKKILKF